jgi:hypothetical protein
MGKGLPLLTIVIILSAKQGRIVKRKSSVVIFVLLLLISNAYAQEKIQHVTAVIPLVDSTVHRFTNIYTFLPLQIQDDVLRGYVKKILATDSYNQQQFYLNKILNMRNERAICLLAFDHYFKNKPPVVGTNVERFYKIICAHDMYAQINEAYLFDVAACPAFKDSVRAKIGWRFGNGAFYYTSPEDSAYMHKMTRLNPAKIDAQVEPIIEKYVAQQGKMFRYDAQAIVKEILAIPGVVNAMYDGCIIKTMQLPNWDNFYVVYVQGKDTIERQYTVEYTTGTVATHRLLRLIKIPSQYYNWDYIYYKEAKFVLHGYARTKLQCDINAAEQERTRREYEEYMKQKK